MNTKKPNSFLINSVIVIAFLSIFLSTVFLYNSYQKITSSYNTTQEVVRSEQKKRLLLNEMLDVAHNRSLILFYMSVEDDPFKLDNLNQQFSDKAGEWIQLRLELEKQPLNKIERDALFNGKDVVNAVEMAQSKAARLLSEGKTSEGLEILKTDVLSEQVNTFDILAGLIGLYKNSTESEIKKIEGRHHQDNINLIILAITIALASLLMISLLIIFIFKHNKKQYELNLEKQKQAARKLAHLASHDQLTNLPNRRYLLDEFNAWKNKSNGAFSVLFIDLNNFKSANDLYGHSIGDQILCEVTTRIEASFTTGINVRQGGDEFIILHSATELQTVISHCETFLQTLKHCITIGDLEFSISASIGIAIAPKDGVEIDDLLRKADMAMYEAKRRNQLIYAFSEHLEKDQARVSLIEHELSHAIERNEYFLVYQPQVNAKSHAIEGVEVLIRWNNQKLGMVSPAEFIHIAEATGYIHEIGQYVFATSMREMHDVCKTINTGVHDDVKLRLSINISVHQLFKEDFLEKIDALIRELNCITVDLVIEMTESLFIDDIAVAKVILNEVKDRNIMISLDDFGTGYSSLSVLSELPINELKIDKSFVNDILINKQARLLIQNIIGLGKNMGIPILAEGVEEQEQATLLTEYGCDLFQGYYFSKPLTKDRLIEHLTPTEQ